MLNGIHILNQTEITEMPSWCYTVFIVVATLIFLIILLYGIIAENDFIGGFLLGLMIGLSIGLIVFIGLLVFVPKVPTGEYRYQVIIDQSVDFKEFDEKYNVIKHEGEIYTILEK